MGKKIRVLSNPLFSGASSKPPDSVPLFFPSRPKMDQERPYGADCPGVCASEATKPSPSLVADQHSWPAPCVVSALTGSGSAPGTTPLQSAGRSGSN